MARQTGIEEKLGLPHGYIKDWSVSRYQLLEAQRDDEKALVQAEVVEILATPPKDKAATNWPLVGAIKRWLGTKAQEPVQDSLPFPSRS